MSVHRPCWWTPRSDRHAILLPLNEVEPLIALALQQGEPLLREGGRWGNFRSHGFRRALAFYLEMFQRGWAGCAPPKGDFAHRYFFQLFALDRELTLPSGTGRSALLYALGGHLLACATLIGTYRR